VVHIFIGRFIQAIASSFMWVVGYATIADSVDSKRLGMIYGVISVAAAVGLSAGPMVSVVLFKIGGYWTAWASAFAILLVDIVLRLLMLENSRRKRGERWTRGFMFQGLIRLVCREAIGFFPCG
jgi:MFS family permease